MIQSYDSQVRHIYLDCRARGEVKPSWYGESVGHYEGDTLVVDTIGLSDKTFVDAYRTPHSDKLHVIERWKLAQDGKGLEVTVTVDDPDTIINLEGRSALQARARRRVGSHLRRKQSTIRLPYAGSRTGRTSKQDH
jgi:hypothetical protein